MGRYAVRPVPNVSRAVQMEESDEDSDGEAVAARPLTREAILNEMGVVELTRDGAGRRGDGVNGAALPRDVPRGLARPNSALSLSSLSTACTEYE